MNTNHKKKAFVTGASGFIGNALVAQLIGEGYGVKVLTRKIDHQFNSQVELVYGDLISETLNLNRVLLDCDLIFHCAGQLKGDENMRQLHVEGTAKLLVSALRSSAKTGRPVHWVQLSSVGTYGQAKPVNSKRNVTEKTLENPSGEYETTKTEADKLVISMASNLMSYTILRPSNVVGPQMNNQSFRALLLTIKKHKFTHIG